MRSWQSPNNRKPPLLGVRVGVLNDDEERPVRHVRRVRATGWALTGAERLSLLACSESECESECPRPLHPSPPAPG